MAVVGGVVGGEVGGVVGGEVGGVVGGEVGGVVGGEVGGVVGGVEGGTLGGIVGGCGAREHDTVRVLPAGATTEPSTPPPVSVPRRDSAALACWAAMVPAPMVWVGPGAGDGGMGKNGVALERGLVPEPLLHRDGMGGIVARNGCPGVAVALPDVALAPDDWAEPEPGPGPDGPPPGPRPGVLVKPLNVEETVSASLGIASATPSTMATAAEAASTGWSHAPGDRIVARTRCGQRRADRSRDARPEWPRAAAASSLAATRSQTNGRLTR